MKCSPGRFERQLDAIGGDIQVSHGSYRRRAEHTEADAMAGESPVIECFPRQTCAPNVEDHDIGLHAIEVERHTRHLSESRCELASPLMILGQALHVMAERIYASGREDARLPLATTALNNRAPSIWVASPREWAEAQTFSMRSNGQQVPPTEALVCSI